MIPVQGTERRPITYDGSVVINSNIVRNRVQAITQKFKIANVDEEVLEFLNLALLERLRNVTEQLVSISQKRMDEKSDVFECVTTSDPKIALRNILQKEQDLAKKREEETKQRLEAMRKSGKDDKAIKDKLSIVDQQREDEKTNMTAFHAIGGASTRRPKYNRRKVSDANQTPSPGTPIGMSVSTGSNENLTTSTQLQQVRRITYKDALVFLERDEGQLTPNFTYKCFLGKDLLNYSQ